LSADFDFGELIEDGAEVADLAATSARYEVVRDGKHNSSPRPTLEATDDVVQKTFFRNGAIERAAPQRRAISRISWRRP
jgi:hypothetical protein